MRTSVAELDRAGARGGILAGVDMSAVLREQDGVISLAQAVAAGVSERTVRRWVAEGRWRRLHPGVYLAEGRRLGPAAVVRAACLWGGPSALVSGPAAAFWFGLLDRLPGPVDLTVPRTGRGRGRPGVTIRRRDLPPRDRTALRGIRLTALPLTVLETAVALPDGTAFLDRALQRSVSIHLLRDAYFRNLGSRGWTQARDLLTTAADGAASRAERRLIALLTDAGIDGWVVGLEVGPWTLDLAFPDARVAIEFDSWAWHTDHERFRRDRRKGNEITLSGWTLLRVTWFDLVEAPARVIAEIRHALLHASRPA